MLAARACRACLSPGITTIWKTPLISRPVLPKVQAARLYANDARTFVRRQRNIAAEAMAPAGEGAYQVGKAALAGSAALGVGALCYYGLGLSPVEGTLERSVFWPDYIKERIHATYLYLGGSIVATAASAAACFRSPILMNLAARQGLVSFGVTLAALIGSGMLVRSIPYQEGFGAKQAAWLMHTAICGFTLMPLSILGGPVLLRAACYTAGIVGGLSAVAVCAPNEKFLNMAGPLAIGLGAVFASSIGTMFLPPTTRLGAGLHSMALYGGLILFSMFLLYDTQRIIKYAETHPYYLAQNVHPYDPISASMSIYLDILNIFIRVVQLTGSRSGQK